MENQYTIGWYKLAEFVWRKEKEKALAIYRLLSHSLNDKGFASQLKADILLAFKDKKASTTYVEAANIYKADNKIIQAIAIYEHLNTLDPLNLDYYLDKMELYLSLNNTYKVKSIFEELITMHENKKEIEELKNIIKSRESGAELFNFVNSFNY